jgi:hypothetical protein
MIRFHAATLAQASAAALIDKLDRSIALSDDRKRAGFTP